MDMKNDLKENEIPASQQPKEAGFGKGKFFSGKRKNSTESATCNTKCSGSCK